jgi:uncharacterized protein DUF5597
MGRGRYPLLPPGTYRHERRESDETFLVAGKGLAIDFAGADAVVEVDHVEEGRFDKGQWAPAAP